MLRPDNRHNDKITMIGGRYAIGVDVGGSHFGSAAVNLDTGAPVGEPCITPVDSRAEASVIIDALAENIAGAVGKAGIEDIAGIGIAFPGPFDYAYGISTVRGVAKYEKIFGLDVASSLRQRLHGLRSYYEMKFLNDAGAFALGESVSGAARDAERVVGITLGTGVGSGFVEHRRLTESGEGVPACGWVYHLPFEDGIADEAFSTRWICRCWLEMTGETVSGAREVAELYGKRPEAGMLFSEYGRRFADFMAPVLSGFRADVLVLGGNISRAYPLFGGEFESGLEKKGCRTGIRLSSLMDRAAVIGAASLFA